MFNPSTPKKYKAPIGRIAQVQSIQDYSKKQKLKVKDFILKNISETQETEKPNSMTID